MISWGQLTLSGSDVDVKLVKGLCSACIHLLPFFSIWEATCSMVQLKDNRASFNLGPWMAECNRAPCQPALDIKHEGVKFLMLKTKISKATCYCSMTEHILTNMPLKVWLSCQTNKTDSSASSVALTSVPFHFYCQGFQFRPPASHLHPTTSHHP